MKEKLIVELFSALEHVVLRHSGAADHACPICALARAAVSDGLPEMLKEYRRRSE